MSQLPKPTPDQPQTEDVAQAQQGAPQASPQADRTARPAQEARPQAGGKKARATGRRAGDEAQDAAATAQAERDAARAPGARGEADAQADAVAETETEATASAGDAGSGQGGSEPPADPAGQTPPAAPSATAGDLSASAPASSASSGSVGSDGGAIDVGATAPAATRDWSFKGAWPYVLAVGAATSYAVHQLTQPKEAPQVTGKLVDSPVAGVEYYVNGQLVGKTGPDGSFTVREGDRVTFKIGAVTLAQDVGLSTDRIVYLQDLVGVARTDATAPAVVKLAQLLQSLDTDGNPANGIVIDPTRLRDGLSSTQVSGETVVAQLLKQEVAVVSEGDALDHVNRNSPALTALDQAAPEVSLSVDAALLSQGQQAVVTVRFNEPVVLWGSAAEVFTVTGGGRLGELVKLDEGRTYTVVYTPPATATTGEVTIALGRNHTDMAGNQGLGGQVSLAYDNVRPTLSLNLPLDTVALDPASPPALGSGQPVSLMLGVAGARVEVSQTPEADGRHTITVQRYRADGAVDGAPVVLQAPHQAQADNTLPTVAAVPGGGYVVTWQASQPGGEPAYFAQTFTADGLPLVQPLSARADTAGTTVVGVQGSEVGVAYLVHRDLDLSAGVSGLRADNADRWNSAPLAGDGLTAEVSAEGLAEGEYVLVLADASGNLSAPLPRTVVVDHTRPTLTISDDQAQAQVNGAVTYTFRFSEAVQQFTAEDVTLAQGSKGAWQAQTYGPDAGRVFTLVVTPPAAAEGADLGLSVGTDWQDLAGNAPVAPTSAEAQAYDRIVPDAPGVALATDTGRSQADHISQQGGLVVSAEPLATIAYSVDGETWQATAPASVEGVNTVHVRQTDRAGNTSAVSTYTYTLDTQVAAPLVSLQQDTGSVATDGITRVSTLVVAGTEPGAQVSYSTDGQSWSILAPQAQEGLNTVLVRQTDVAGNVSAATEIRFTLDRTVATPTLSLAADTGRADDAGAGTDLVTRNAQIVVGQLESGGSWSYQVDGTGPWLAGSGNTLTATEGTHSYVVRQTDVAGNTSVASGALTVTLDTAVLAPIVSLASDTGLSASDAITRSADLSLAGLEPRAAVTYSTDGNTWSSTLAPANEGANTVYVRQTDVAGNTSSAAQIQFTLDRTVATPVLALLNDSGRPGEAATLTDGITNQPTIGITGLEAGGSWSYQVDGAGPWIAGSGNTLEALDGTHSYVVRQVDVAGNTATSSAISVTAILAPQGISVQLVDGDGELLSGAVSTDPATALRLSGAASDQWQYRFVTPGTAAGAWQDVGAGDLPLGEGAHLIETRKIDVANNYVSAFTQVNVDSQAATPTMTLVNDGGDGRTTSPGVLIGGLEGHAVWEVKVDDQPNWSVVRSGSNQFTLQAGTHSYQIRQTDQAGNTSAIGTYTFTYQSEVAQPTLRVGGLAVSADQALASSQRAIAVDGLIDGATWQVRTDGGDWVNAQGSSFDMLADGREHRYEVRQQFGGKFSEPTVLTSVRFDDTAPGAFTVALQTDSGSSASDGITNVGTLNLGNLEVGAQLAYRVDGGDWKTVTVVSPTQSVQLNEGTHQYDFRVVDAAGNATSTVTRTYTYIDSDLPAPTLSLAEDTRVQDDGVTANAQVNVALAVSGSGVSWQYEVDGSGVWTTGTGTSFQALAGRHSYKVRQLDVAGNTSPSSAALSITVDADAPVFNSGAVARVTDADSLGVQQVGTQTVLYTARVSDGLATTWSLADSDVFNFNTSTGALTFKQPVGYRADGANSYTATLTATDAAGNARDQVVTVHVDRTNTATPTITLSEPRSGKEALDAGKLLMTLMADGTQVYLAKDVNGVGRLYMDDANGNPVPGYTPHAFSTNDFNALLSGGSSVTTLSKDAAGKITLIQAFATNIYKFNADGTPDTSFGVNGVVSATAAGSGIAILDGAVDGQNRTYLVGYQQTIQGDAGTTDGVVAVLNPNGTLLSKQTLVGVSGGYDVYTKAVPAGGNAMYLVSKGKYNSNVPQSDNDFVVQKFVNGVLDSSFGSGGKVNPPGFSSTQSDSYTNILADNLGRLIISQPFGTSVKVSRYTTSGVLDTSFGSGGAITLANASGDRIQVMADNSLYINTTNSSTSRTELRHYTSAGALDTTLGSGGVLVNPVSGVNDVKVTSDQQLIFKSYDSAARSSFLSYYNLVGGQAVVNNDHGAVALTYNEGNRPIGLLSLASKLSDADAALTSYAGVSLTIAREGGAQAQDAFGARGKLLLADGGSLVFDGVEVGSHSQVGGALNLVFNDQVNQSTLDGVARSITYRNTGSSLPGAIRLVWTLNDNDPTGARQTSVSQTVNLKDDLADVGDSSALLKVGSASATLNHMIEVNGKYYYVIDTIPRSDGHNLLDTLFNGGADTTVNARSVSRADGAVFKLLTSSEITALFATDQIKADAYWKDLLTSPKMSSDGLSYSNGIWAADLGSAANQHLFKPHYSTTFQATADANGMQTLFAIVEATPGTVQVDDYVAPTIRLLVDNGDSTTDRLTSDGRVEVVGLSSGLPYEISTDGGRTWAIQAAGALIVDLPAGVYTAGSIMARQTDASGFTDLVLSNASIKVDKNLKAVGLLNDQGLNGFDGQTADGRVTLTGIDPNLAYEYSLDAGSTWQTGGTLPGGAYGFTLPTGSYAVGSVRIRQVDSEGFVTSGRNAAAYQVGPSAGQGIVSLAVDNGDNKTDRITSDDRLVVNGLDVGQDIAYSLDQGQSWTTVSNTARTSTLMFSVPQGTYAANSVLVRQTDSKGYTTTLANPQPFSIDKTVKNLGLYNDQGLSTSDNASADGRMVASGLIDALGFEYSVDNGSSWQTGARVDGVPIFTLTAGNYASGAVQVRQNLGNGLTSVVKTTTAVTVSNVEGQGAITLDVDAGGSATDNLTNVGTLTVTGLRGGVAWDYSLDQGNTWQAGVPASGSKQVINLPDGSYAIDQIRVRQTDAKGYTTTSRNGVAYVVDTQIATAGVALVSDTGYSATDLLTADGRVQFTMGGVLAAGDTWSYSTDGGATWQGGSGSSVTVTLANGRYAANTIRVKVSDQAGNASSAAFDKAVVVDNTDLSAPVFTNATTSVALDRDGTGTRQLLKAGTSLMTVSTTDANAVYYSLSGAQAGLFNINGNGQISFKADTNLASATGDSYALTVTATDAFNNASTQNVTLKVASPFQMVSRSVGSVYDVIESSTYEVVFSHDIVLDPAGRIRLYSGNNDFPERVLNLNDPSQVKVEGNRLIIATGGLSDQGVYRVDLGSSVKSALTSDVFTAPSWPEIGFRVDQSVGFSYSYSRGAYVASSVGSYVVAGLDGTNAKGNVAVVGDVNGDGIDDWVMSASDGDSLGRTNNGKIYVIYGDTSGTAPNLGAVANGAGGFLVSGGASGDLAGQTVANAGDVNNDGLQDIAIFASGANGGNGKSYVLFGRKAGGNIDLASVEGNAALGKVYTVNTKDAFGAIGDINGDGYDDVAHGRGDLDRVTTWDVKTETVRTQVATTKIVQKADWLNFAANIADSLATAYAFFDDPLTAVIETGAEWEDSLQLAIEDQDVDMNPVQQAVFDAIVARSRMLDYSFQRITDIKVTQSGGGGGGVFNPPKDLVITIDFTIESKQTQVTRYTQTMFGAGEAILELGGASGYGGSTRVLGTINATQVGAQVAALGDINGDGRADFGVLEIGSGGVLARLDVVFGKRNLGEVSTATLDTGVGGFRISDPTRTTEYVGEGNVTGLGDINGDGLADFAVTLDVIKAPTYVVYGRAGMTGVNLSQVAAGQGGYLLANAGTRSNKVVDAIGDFNGDGLDDFVYYNSQDTGFTSDAYVIYGSRNDPGLANKSYLTDADLGYGTKGFVIDTGKGMFDREAVSAGDINGDGLTDLIIRDGDAASLVLMGSTSTGKFGQVRADLVGGAGNDTLTSTGSDLVVAGAGDDRIATNGADVVLAGAGHDRIVLDGGMITALQNDLGAGGNTTRLAKIDGGAGLDVLELRNGLSLDFTRIDNKMMDLDNIKGRVADVERIDMRTDTAANTVKLALIDVLEMGNANAFNSFSGWTGLGSQVSLTQVAIDGGANDRVELTAAQWRNTGVFAQDTTGASYRVYQANDGVAAQLLIRSDVVIGG